MPGGYLRPTEGSQLRSWEWEALHSVLSWDLFVKTSPNMIVLS